MKLSDLKSLIKEEAQKLHRRTLLENEKRSLMKELGGMGEYNHGDEESSELHPKALQRFIDAFIYEAKMLVIIYMLMNFLMKMSLMN